MQEKQTLIDATHNSLREASASLLTERQRLSLLQSNASDRKALRHRLATLHAANAQHRLRVAAKDNVSVLDVRTNISIGEADAGLLVDTTVLPLNLLDSPSPPHALTPEQKSYLSTLPSPILLQARARGYRKINTALEADVKGFSERSIGLEDQLRRVVALCTGVEESRVDEMVGGLVRAVESEGGGDVEVGRVREFLRRVEEEG